MAHFDRHFTRVGRSGSAALRSWTARTSCAGFAVVTMAAVVPSARPAAAQLPFPRLDSIFPPGAAAGSSIEVRLRGADLDDLTQLRFTHVGLDATPRMDEPEMFHPAARPRPGEFTVRIDKDVPPGIYEVQAIGRFGISNPRRFHVDALENAVETGAREG